MTSFTILPSVMAIFLNVARSAFRARLEELEQSSESFSSVDLLSSMRAEQIRDCLELARLIQEAIDQNQNIVVEESK